MVVGTPSGRVEQVSPVPPPPTTERRIHQSPLVLDRLGGDRDARSGDGASVYSPSTPTQRRINPSPLGPWCTMWVEGGPVGGCIKRVPPPPPPRGAVGGFTRVPWVLGGPCVDRDAQWEGAEGVCSSPPLTLSAATPESSRSWLGRVSIRTPNGKGEEVRAPSRLAP